MKDCECPPHRPGRALTGASGPRRTIHVFVSLADNQNQGIVPVPARLGRSVLEKALKLDSKFLEQHPEFRSHYKEPAKQ